MVLKPEELEDKARRLCAGDKKAIEEMLEEEIDSNLFRDRCNIRKLAFVPFIPHGTIYINDPKRLLSNRYWNENLGSFSLFIDDDEFWNFFRERLLKKYNDAGWDVEYVPRHTEWVGAIGKDIQYSPCFNFSRRNKK